MNSLNPARDNSAEQEEPKDHASVRTEMSQKKVFLVLVATSVLSLLLTTCWHYGGDLRGTMEAFFFAAPCSQTSSPPGPPKPPKRTNVAFLKTHKTAGSTVQNLLFRFAERHGLAVALPVEACGHQFCYPRPFSARFVRPGAATPPNIIASHMRFDRAEVRKLMPNDTAYITILREPVSMFESMFTYYRQQCQSFRKVPGGSLEAFLEEPGRYYRPDGDDVVPARNAMTFDLGGDKDRPATDAAYVRDFVAEVDRSFSLVMIAEYFDESLVLLRHLLSWDLDDVLYVKLNVCAAGSKRSLLAADKGLLAAKIRGWNSLDAWLYDHFNASLWRKLAALGPACVAREVRLLRREAQERLMRSCFGGREPPRLRPAKQIRNEELRPWQPGAGVDIMGYDLRPNNVSRGTSQSQQVPELCLKLIMPEVQYTKALLRSQKKTPKQTLGARGGKKYSND